MSHQAGRSSERGTALFVALALVIILVFLGFGLLSRSFFSSRFAGLERWPAKTFYAADSGINAARARLRLHRKEAFSFEVPDLRGAAARPAGRPIVVKVEALRSAGPARPAVGSQVGGGQGSGSMALYTLYYGTRATAAHQTTRSRRRITTTLSLGPVPLPASGH